MSAVQRYSSDEEEDHSKKKYKFGKGIKAIKKKIDDKKREERKHSMVSEPHGPFGKLKQNKYVNWRGKNRNVSVAVIGAYDD